MASIRKITSDADFLSAINLSSRAFAAKCPLFQLDKIPSSDFVKYYNSMKSSIISSKFLYALWVSNEMKAAFMCIPSEFEISPKRNEGFNEVYGELTNPINVFYKGHV